MRHEENSFTFQNFISYDMNHSQCYKMQLSLTYQSSSILPIPGQLQTVGVHKELPVPLPVLHDIPRGKVWHKLFVGFDRRRSPVEPGAGPMKEEVIPLVRFQNVGIS